MPTLSATRRAAAAAIGCAMALSGSATLAQAPKPPAPDLFPLFKRVCADNGGVYSRTVAAADVQSWSKLPFPLPIPTGDAKLSRKTIRTKPSQGGFGLFFAGEGEIKAGERRLPFQMCAIGAKPAGFAATVSQVQGWMGQPPINSEKGAKSFRYHLGADGSRAPLPPGKLRDAAARLGPGTVVSVDVAPQKDTTMISYSIIKL